MPAAKKATPRTPVARSRVLHDPLTGKPIPLGQAATVVYGSGLRGVMTTYDVDEQTARHAISEMKRCP